MAHKSPDICRQKKLNQLCAGFPFPGCRLRVYKTVLTLCTLESCTRANASKCSHKSREFFWTELHRLVSGLCDTKKQCLAANQRPYFLWSANQKPVIDLRARGPRSRPGPGAWIRDRKSLTNSFHRVNRHELNFHEVYTDEKFYPILKRKSDEWQESRA